MARAGMLVLNLLAGIALKALAQLAASSWTDREKLIYDRIHTLRGLPDSQRPAATKDLALKIRQLPVSPG